MPRVRRTELSDKQRDYLEWLLVHPLERTPQTKLEMAQQLGVTDRTLRTWEKKDYFIEAWNERADEEVGAPDILHGIVQNMIKTAQGRNLKATAGQEIQAADLYLRYRNLMRPPSQRIEIENKSSFESKSDDELLAELGLAEGPSGAPSFDMFDFA